MRAFSHKQIYQCLLLLVVILYPFWFKLSNGALLALGVHWLVWVLREPGAFRWRSPLMWLLLSLYLITAVSVLYSANLKVAIFALDKKISLLILPLVIGTSPALTGAEFRRLVLAATGAVSAALLLCLVWAAYRSSSLGADAFFWTNLTVPLGDFHPTYFSLYINFLICWLAIYLIKQRKSSWRRGHAWIVAELVLLYGSLLLLSSKLQLIMAGVIPFVIAVCYMNSRQLRWLLPAFAAVLIVAVLVVTQTKASERFKHITTLNYDLAAPVSTFNELTIRLALAECSWMIIKDHPLFGVGAGDVYEELDKVYRKVDYKFGYLDQQNPHNQYLSQWLATGIIGLALLLSILLGMFVMAIKTKQYDLLVLIILFVASFAIESMLERQKGIVLFSLLLSLYGFVKRSP